jgi:CRP/FNR family cyclic AMP-dependent transcriptional regulator
VTEVLARAGIFQGVAPDAIAALTAHLKPASFPLGHIVFHEGDAGDELYIITSGKVKIGRTGPYGKEGLIAILGPADMFGELALFDPGPRTSTVTTLTAVEALTMDRHCISGSANTPRSLNSCCGSWPDACDEPTTTSAI